MCRPGRRAWSRGRGPRGRLAPPIRHLHLAHPRGPRLDRGGRIGRGVRGARGRARPAELVALVLALAEHEALDERERRRLDREIGMCAAGSDRVSLLRAWLAEAPSPALAARIRRIAPALRALSALVGSIGLFLGWLAASALLSLEVHEGRINIVASIAVLVLLPVLTWLFGLLGWLGVRLGRASGHWGAGHDLGLGDGLRRGLLGGLLLRAMPQSVRQDIEVVMGRVAAHGRLYSDVRQGQLLLWAQLLGVGFGLGALLATLAFVVFTDLAFGWSTTLDVGAEPVHRIVRGMALPWGWLWPAASPSLELVETTRFFRVVREDHVPVVDPILYGGWWPFLVMAIASYAWLPRVATAVAISLWLSRATATAMALTPGVDGLLDRLRTPFVDGRAPSEATAEAGAAGAGGRGAPLVDLRSWGRARAAEGSTPCLIRWAGAEPGGAKGEPWDPLPGASPGRSPWVGDAGGGQSLEADAELARACARAGGAVLVCVRGYEPPLLDFMDFLDALRADLGPERGIAVALLGGREAEIAAWRRRIAARGDARLVVGRIEAEGGAGGAGGGAEGGSHD